eukprot:1184985-Pyramimonas_sp.AAC.1
MAVGLYGLRSCPAALTHGMTHREKNEERTEFFSGRGTYEGLGRQYGVLSVTVHSATVLSRWTNKTHAMQVYSHGGPIRGRWHTDELGPSP